ncbi:MAG: hypothetical protein ABIH03_04015 [Pseudomonadota bacterium]
MFLKRIGDAAAQAGANTLRAVNGHRAAALGVRGGDRAFLASTGVLAPIRIAR